VSKSRWQPYPAYKDSGMEWLGKIPARWEMRQLKYALSRNDSGVWGEDPDGDGTTVLRSTDMTVDGKWAIVEPARRKLSVAEYASAHLQVGDLVVTKSSGSALHLGKTALVTSEVEALDGCFSNFMQRLRPRTGFESGYIYWIINSPIGREQLNYLGSTTTGLANLNGSVIGSICIPAPGIAEQRAIAAFLNRETARIDALVTKQDRLIALLQEKRAALISHAVTKGLDLTVPMNSCGIPWLGESPAHWRLLQLRRVVSQFVDYRGKTPEKAPNGIPLITAKNIKHGIINFDLSQEFIREEDYNDWMVRGLPEIGDVLVTTEAPLGESAQIVDTRAALAQRIILLKADKQQITNDYLKYSFAAGSGQGELWSRATGSTAIGIKAYHLRDILVPVPPIEEQEAITAHVDCETAKLDALIAKAQQMIGRLQEYRTALISAAVTGKVDVRGTETKH